jgi:hypothetical protein
MMADSAEAFCGSGEPFSFGEVGEVMELPGE